jgi:hypothetical protein
LSTGAQGSARPDGTALKKEGLFLADPAEIDRVTSQLRHQSARAFKKHGFLTWNAALETGGFLVGDEVRLNLSIQAIAQ